MDPLLSAAVDAHGGIDNWRQVTKLTAKLSVGGFFWAARGWPAAGGSHTVTLDPHHQRVTLSAFPDAGSESVLEIDPDRIIVRDAGGETIDERLDPRA
jgi:hypothetical protein